MSWMLIKTWLQHNAEVVGLFFLAFAVRIAILPYWKDLALSGDEIHYWTFARAVAKGSFFSNFLHPPLWTYLLGIPAAFSEDPFAGRLATVIISSISAAVIYVFGKLLFTRKVGLIAGVIYSVYPNIVGFSHYLWPESLLSLLVLIAGVLFFQWSRNDTQRARLDLASLALGLALLVKEFALIAFVAMILGIIVLKVAGKARIVLRSSLIFIAPALMYSTVASVNAARPVVLADAFVFNSNEADDGKAVWEFSTKDNLKVFARRIMAVERMPRRLGEQLLNLWTPTSFPIFRLLKSMEGYRDVPQARLIAYFTAGSYILVIALGLAGMCCARKDELFWYSVANVFLLSSAGMLFMMCSRFRISFMYIFILYAATLGDFAAVGSRINWRRAMVCAALMMVFGTIIVIMRSAFGNWG